MSLPNRLALAAVALLACLSPEASQAQIFSPGDLASPHAKLEGLSNCTKCHEPGDKKSARRCLLCHKELAQILDKGRGLHAQKATRRQACFSCHPDHKGRSASLSHWAGPKSFDHSKTGYALTGGHQKAKCESCHQAGRVDKASLAQRFKQKNLGTYLGLERACERCHFDEHRGTLGADCKRCHNTKAFKPAPRFDHQKTAYPLQGAHQKVGCNKCHGMTKPDTRRHSASRTEPPKDPTRYRSYKPQAFERCTECHKDVHAGKFGPHCADCHTVASWSTEHTAKEDRRFHQKTRYPLEGRHQQAPCASCHPKRHGKLKTRGLRFKRCTDCHLDAHFGQMPTQKQVLHCEHCHSVEGFYPTRFPLEDHQKNRFPLEGAHRAVACNACHPAKPELFQSKVPAALRRRRGRLQGNKLLNFTEIKRPKTAPTRCETCHQDPHRGQFSQVLSETGKNASTQKHRACAACHTVANFETLEFDHAREAKFPLLGPHKTAACSSCHPPDPALQGAARFRGTPRACASCHGDAHGGQFGDPLKQGCAPCHVDGDAKFKPSHFDHVKVGADRFRLEGKHAAVQCAACHPASSATQKSAIWYRGVPKRCDGCHQDPHPGLDRTHLPGRSQELP